MDIEIKEVSQDPTIAIPNKGCQNYLTAGKEYEIIKNYGPYPSKTIFFEIKPDSGKKSILCIKHPQGSMEIDGHSPNGWTLK